MMLGHPLKAVRHLLSRPGSRRQKNQFVAGCGWAKETASVKCSTAPPYGCGSKSGKNGTLVETWANPCGLPLLFNCEPHPYPGVGGGRLFPGGEPAAMAKGASRPQLPRARGEERKEDLTWLWLKKQNKNRGHSPLMGQQGDVKTTSTWDIWVWVKKRCNPKNGLPWQVEIWTETSVTPRV